MNMMLAEFSCYDPISRLQSISHGFTTPGNNLILGFGYNPASQIISETRDNDAYVHRGDYNVTRAYVANGLNQYTSAGPASFTYDPNGNLTSDGAVTYAYDIENRIVGASGAKTANLRYDPLGRLYEVNAGSASSATRFLYDGDALVAEYDGTSNALSRRYIHGPGVDEPLIWYEGADLTNRRSLRANHQGSIIAVAGPTGEQIGALTYDPYGIPGADNATRFQYTGQIYIKEIGLYHYKARAYSPTHGRFLQTDPIGYEDQVNLYAYVGNDPVNTIDPSGSDSYLVSRPLGIPGADTLNIDHAFIATDARYLGDPKATIVSFGPLKNGQTGNISDGSRATEKARDTNKVDRAAWISSAKGASSSALIDASDKLVKALVSGVKENDKYAAVPGTTSEGTNSNSAAFAVANNAGSYDKEAFRGVNLPGRKQANRVDFDEPKICNTKGLTYK